MFDRSEDIQLKIEALFNLAASCERGDTLLHKQISRVLKCDCHQGCWDYVVGRVRKRIEQERGISTWPVHGVGYRFCTEDEQANEIPRRRQQRARRQVRKGLASVEALPIEGLNDFQLKIRSVRIEQMRRSASEIASEIRTMSAMTIPSETSPRVRPVSIPQTQSR